MTVLTVIREIKNGRTVQADAEYVKKKVTGLYQGYVIYCRDVIDFLLMIASFSEILRLRLFPHDERVIPEGMGN